MKSDFPWDSPRHAGITKNFSKRARSGHVKSVQVTSDQLRTGSGIMTSMRGVRIMTSMRESRIMMPMRWIGIMTSMRGVGITTSMRGMRDYVLTGKTGSPRFTATTQQMIADNNKIKPHVKLASHTGWTDLENIREISVKDMAVVSKISNSKLVGIDGEGTGLEMTFSSENCDRIFQSHI